MDKDVGGMYNLCDPLFTCNTSDRFRDETNIYRCSVVLFTYLFVIITI